MQYELLTRLKACGEAREWAAGYDTLQAAWLACNRGDWMLWLAGRLSGGPDSPSRKRLVLAACGCARTALRHIPAGEDRPRIAIETAERWARGEEGVTLQMVQAAAHAASAYSDSAYDVAHATAAADAAAYSAYAYAPHSAAARAAAAAACAAYVASAYVYTYDVVAVAAIDAANAQCAAIVRQHYPTLPVEDTQ